MNSACSDIYFTGLPVSKFPDWSKIVELILSGRLLARVADIEPEEPDNLNGGLLAQIADLEVQ